MKLPDQFHCSNCRGRLVAVSADALRCTDCERSVPVADGIADFVGGSLRVGIGCDRYRGDPRGHKDGKSDLFTRIQHAAGDRWPISLGDTMEFGCGRGETTCAIVGGQMLRSLLVLDTEIDMLQACRSRITERGLGSNRHIAYA